MKTFFGMTSKEGLHVFFCKRWAPFFEIKQRWALFFLDFRDFARIFDKSKLLGMRLHPHLLHHCMLKRVIGKPVADYKAKCTLWMCLLCSLSLIYMHIRCSVKNNYIITARWL